MIKKVIVFANILCLSVIISNAQELSVGVRAGLNFSNQTLTNLPQPYPSVRTGFLLGGYAKWMATQKIGIQSELFYSSLGAIYNPSITEAYNYLSLPIVFRYNPNDNFHLLLGPQINALLTAKETVSGATLDIKYQSKTIDLGGVAGIGFNIGAFDIGARYYLGLSNKIKPQNQTNGESIKNTSFQIVVGYSLWKNK